MKVVWLKDSKNNKNEEGITWHWNVVQTSKI